MRTTIDIDDDILVLVKDIASERGVSAGRVMSDLTRSALTASVAFEVIDGIPLLPERPGKEIVTLELVNRLRDEE